MCVYRQKAGRRQVEQYRQGEEVGEGVVVQKKAEENTGRKAWYSVVVKE